jgi:heme exporter protein C
MRERIMLGLAVLASILLVRNLYQIFLVLPDEASQGAIWRIFYFHVPSAMLGMTGFLMSMVFSLLYLWRKNLKWDALAAGIVEVSLVFGAICLVTGSIWGRIIWGIWWTWDARLTSMLVCWLLFAGYLMMRRAIEDPTTRARLSAVLSVFGSVNVVIIWKSIEWWRTQHPGPVLSIRQGGGMEPGMESVMYWNLLALLAVALILIMLRMRQESMQRELDALRRQAHAL